jgi:hypothetical protein
MFLSWNDGLSWEPFQQNLPLTPITDIKVHQNDLVLSTMGRGFWILDNLSPLQDNALPELKQEVKLFAPQSAVRRYEPMGRHNGFPKYPRLAVDIDYYLPNGYEGPLVLEVLDAKGKIVQSLASDSLGNTNVLQEDMGLNMRYLLVEKELKTEAGLHRYRWDMRQRGPWDARLDRRYKNGPLVAPGIYTVRLRAKNRVIEQKLELVLDPRLAETGISRSDVEAQAKLQIRVLDLLSETRRAAAAWSKELEELNTKDSLSLEETNRHDLLGRIMAEMKSDPEVIYAQPMLVDQVSYLYYMLNGADQRPGQDAYDRYDDLVEKWKALKARVNG